MKNKQPEPEVDEVEVFRMQGEDADLASARTVAGPFVANAIAAKLMTGERLSTGLNLKHFTAALADGAERINKGDLKEVEALLYAQAMTLNTMFGRFSRQMGNSLVPGESFEAPERWYKLAMKAQNQCRMTLETLANVKNPPVVYARQANINNGGQQQVNNGASPRAGENQTPPTKILEQSNEQWLDTTTQGATGGGNPALETVAALHGAENT